MSTLLWAMVAFASGSIPFGLIIARAHGVDIRKQGSGNIGATNVLRVLGKRPGLLCFALDVAKGLIPTLAAGWSMGPLGASHIGSVDAWRWLAVMAASVLGHMFTPLAGFKGGKGVATGLGALAGVWPVLTVPALAALAVFIGVFRATGYVGIASCIAAVSLPLWVVTIATFAARAMGTTFDLAPFLIVVSVVAAVVVFKHKANIVRTLKGTENRFGARGKAVSSSGDHRAR